MKRSSLPRTNPARRRRLFRKQFGSKARVERIKQMDCIAAHCGTPPCDGPIENAHVTSRGAGSTWESIVPLCATHHRNQHSMGTKTFEEHIGRDLAAEAQRIAEEIDQDG